MGFCVPDIARSADDFSQCQELIERLSPSSIVPPLGQPGNLTYVIRDDDDRAKIQGLIHVESSIQVRNMLVDPGFKYQDASFTLLHRGMEMQLRVTGTQRYQFIVPKDQERIIKMFKKDGARVIDSDMIHFQKEL